MILSLRRYPFRNTSFTSPSFESFSVTCWIASIRYGSNGRERAGISWRPASRRALVRLSRTIRIPLPASPWSASTAASISSRMGRRRARSASWANLTTISASRSARFCTVGLSSVILVTFLHPNLVATTTGQCHVEHAVSVGRRDRLGLDRVQQFHLRMEDSAVCADRVDGEPRAFRHYLKRLAGDPGKFQGHVDSRGCHDDFRGGFTHPIALIRDRRGWPEGRSGRGTNSRQAPVRVDPPQKAVERARPCVPIRGRFLGHLGTS